MIYGDTFDSAIYDTAILQVPGESINTYKENYVWRNFKHIEFPCTLVENIELDPWVWEGEERDVFTVSATLYPADASNKQLAWSSSDENVATVDAEGNVTALNQGTCQITAKATDGSGVSAVCTVYVILKTGIDENIADRDDAVMSVYTLNGVLVMETSDKGHLDELAPAVYIVRQGNTIKKIVVK